MGKKNLTLEQKKLDTDIWIIALITMGMFLFYMMFGNQMMDYIKDSSNSIILRLALNGGVQFGIAGLGITLVCIYRKERFSQFGLVKRNTIKAIFYSIICFVPYIMYIFISGQYTDYKPFSIIITNDVLNSGVPINILGMILIIIVWGFFEGFNYAVISDKLNNLYPSKNKWFNVGAIICAIVCILFHPFSTSFWGIVEIITMFIAIYGMLIVKDKTNNAWGCVFVFCFIWNAF
ncbi:hypothetical protein [Paraclostridium sordellii]|uniref:CAAX protease self-immunity family protein n=1 Tax=Paraclostridium sordellii TaxID=1505 RepID=A0A0C7R2H9_PARSO|nr:hypothetical protein [Paeniclostridium sordellii]CEN78313.1 Uncharacterised protein [[Clostridium] sordellii] [Paeniclostridium sordellii]CEO08240.1 Uncharacterised protein [[Clostridium] sordellii] [Paeniclostridium sordellii]CEO34735.1 Uncharacterised protein [[Clostridium] sordellii] [Paeniclostridium sordellii]CEP87142.1 Uncharacterised protein [[Clostridium] sordellii] [Paeniclostridium sordellii]CEP93248.1 Uncharacterised protein [[Clostridium] sordellii] [Paeniclostridium sordellii]